MSNLGRWLLVGLSWLAAITAWGSILWFASFAANLIDESTRQWPFIREWLLAVMQLFGYFIVFWLITVVLCSVAGVIYAVAWGLPRLGRAGARMLNELGRMILYSPERAISFIGFLEGLSINIVERGIAYLREASATGLRWITGSGRGGVRGGANGGRSQFWSSVAVSLKGARNESTEKRRGEQAHRPQSR